jgi:hypothetical protein
MKKYLLITFLFFFSFQCLWSQVEKYHRVKIFTPQNEDINLLAAKGLALQNIERKPEAFVIGEFSESELMLILETGLVHEIIIEDMTSYYVDRNSSFSIDQINSEIKISRRSINGYITPENFSLGSMGGYHTYDELLDELDEMRTLFPSLISVKQPIGTTNSIEGRPVYWVRISNAPEVDQEKPSVLYTALMHAREPASLQQMLYQMWYLLENYDTDPEIQYLIDNLELFFIPCINPDGYIYNQTINPNGGGMWRKNRRVNGGGTYGVDLNRNFGYNWGYDNSGSSPYGNSETYRGTGPFSEPETQLVKQFCEEREISLALNNHTYSDLLIYPWGYANLLTPDSLIFIEYAKLLTSENNYTYGTCYQTLSYYSNGGSDDWFYGEQTTKNKIFAFTPEAGSSSDGFWPAVNRIEEICAGHTGMNLYLARFALAYAHVNDVSPRIFSSLNSYIRFEITSLGQVANSSFTVSALPVSSNIYSVGDPIVFNDLEILETALDSISITLKPNISNGELVKYVIKLNNGDFTYTDTITKVYGLSEIIIVDPCDNMNNWTSTSWNITTQHYFSAPTSINDSPNTNYPNNSNSTITLDMNVDLTDATMAWIEFMARWDIEKNWDYAQFMVSTNEGATWTPLQGNFTATGGSNQDPGKPIYHGTQSEWVNEEVSLDEYIGQIIKFRFRLVSDYTVNGQGFFFDDFKIEKMVASSNPQLNLPSELSFAQGSSLTIDASEYISNFVEGLELSWEGNENIAIESDGWDITLTAEEEWLGSEEVTFTISGDFGESSCIVLVSCVAANSIPVIVGQLEIITYKNESVDISLDHLIVEDEDNNYPDDFTLTILEGNNYTFNDLTITPATDFVGMLTVPVFVSDGIDESDVYELMVEVKLPVKTNEIIDNNAIRLHYSEQKSILTIYLSSDDKFNRVEIIDLQGRIINSSRVSNHSERIVINLSKPAKGIYIVRLIGQSILSEKIAL